MAFGHGWASDPLGPTPSELRQGDDVADAAWLRRCVAMDAAEQAAEIAEATAEGALGRVTWLESNTCRQRQDWMGIGPSGRFDHRSGSGTVAWSIASDGTTKLVVTNARDDGKLQWAATVTTEGWVKVTRPCSFDPESWEASCQRRVLTTLIGEGRASAIIANPIPEAPAPLRPQPGPIRAL